MKISEKFQELRNKKEKALIIYITGGFPTIKEFIDNFKKIEESGADIIEIGIPFSDPIADGPIIQYSSHKALLNGATLDKIFESLKIIKPAIPVVFMSYLNPLIAYGKNRFLKKMKEVGVSGLIIPDLPVEESIEWRELSKKNGLELIFLLSPNTSTERAKMIAKFSKGFIYCVSVKGITGVRESLPDELSIYLDKVKKISNIPIAVGFGISNEEQIELLKDKVDGIIMGSRIIKGIKDGEDIENLIKKFKEKTRC